MENQIKATSNPVTPQVRANAKLLNALVQAEPLLASVNKIQLLITVAVLRKRLLSLRSMHDIQL